MKEEDLFNDPTTEPKSDWMKFVNVGDSVQGVLLEKPQEMQSKLGPQVVYTLETTDRGVVMVGLKQTSHVRAIRQLKQAEIGDIIAFKFAGTYKTDKGNDGKSIAVRIKSRNLGLSPAGADDNGQPFK